MNVKEFAIFIAVTIGGFLIGIFCTSLIDNSDNPDSSNNYVKANRYSHCIERLSDSVILSFNDMKEVCSEYLK